MPSFDTETSIFEFGLPGGVVKMMVPVSWNSGGKYISPNFTERLVELMKLEPIKATLVPPEAGPQYGRISFTFGGVVLFFLFDR